MKKWISTLLLVCGTALAAPTDDGMYATLQTSMGDVCFELYYTNVPQTVANFVSLAEGARPWIDPRTTFVSTEPYYDGITFHRVVTNFMIQCGSPKGDGTDGPGYSFEDEFDSSLRHDRPGVVSMANSGFDSNGGQFFITVGSQPGLDDVHSVFGSVIEGMAVVSKIVAVEVDAGSKPLDDVVITNVFITRNGSNALSFSVTNQELPEVSALPMAIAGLNLSTGTETSSYQYVYSSTNLAEWAGVVANYWPVPDGDWSGTTTGEINEFFHANRVVYPSDKNRTGNPSAHRLVMMIGSDVLTITPDGINSGHVIVNSGTNAVITYWDWRASPHLVSFDLQSDYYYPFGFDLYYNSSTNGTCGIYYYNSGWQKIGDGTFTDQDLN